MKISDKTKYLLALSSLQGLKRELELAKESNQDIIEWALTYIDYTLRILNECEV